MRPDLVTEIAREVMGRPDAHMASIEWLSVERDGIDAHRIELRDAPLITRGPNAGRPNWRKSSNPQTRIFPAAELQLLAAEWSQRTGKCAECTGSGRQFVRWSADEGTTWRPCKVCAGSGGPGGAPAVDQGALL